MRYFCACENIIVVTIEDRYVIDVADLLTVRLECGACGTAVTVKAADWMGNTFECPVCHVTWMKDRSPQHNTMHQLAQGLRGVQALAQENFRIRFEINRPKA